MLFTRIAVLTFTAASALFSADQGLLSLVNPDAKVVGGMNVARTMSSPLGQFLLTRMNGDDPGFREFTLMTGFDPRRDLREVVFASSGEPANRHAGVLVARGVFNGPQIVAAAKAKGAQTVTYKGIEMLQNKGGSMAVVDGSLVIAGDETNVKAAIDRRSVSALPATAAFRKASTMMNRYDAWMISTAPVSQFAGSAPNKQMAGTMQSNALQGILETSGGITFDSMIAIEGEAVTRSDKDAQALIDVFKFLMGMMQMNASNTQQMKLIEPMLSSLQLQAEASTVKFSMRFAEADLEQLIQSSKKPAKRAQVVQ